MTQQLSVAIVRAFDTDLDDTRVVLQAMQDTADTAPNTAALGRALTALLDRPQTDSIDVLFAAELADISDKTLRGFVERFVKSTPDPGVDSVLDALAVEVELVRLRTWYADYSARTAATELGATPDGWDLPS